MYRETHYSPAQGNYSKRWNTCEGVVWHHSADSLESAITVCMGLARRADGSLLRAGYHTVIAMDGERHTFVPDQMTAYHAGQSEWRSVAGTNSRTLGVAFTGDTSKRRLEDVEIASALEWLSLRWDKYAWTIESMTTHRAVCRPHGRKVDISIAAELQLFAAIKERYVHT